MPPTSPLGTGVMKLAAEGLGSYSYWIKEIETSKKKTLTYKDQDWDRNIRSYGTKTLGVAPAEDTVIVPRDFSFVEQKSAQLFFQTPEIHLTAKQDNLKDAVPVFQAVVNHYLSEDEVDALAVMNEVAFDALCPAGIMCSVIGYESFTQGPPVPMPTGEMEADPNADQGLFDGSNVMGQSAPGLLPGQVLGTGAPAPAPAQVPVMQPTPNVVHSRYFWSRLSPASILIPVSFSGSIYDRAPWLGYRAKDSWQMLKKTYQLTDTDPPKTKHSGGGDQDLKLQSEKQGTEGQAEDEVEYVVIWYRTAYFDPTVGHPEKFSQLVFLMGRDQPIVHRPSPFQYEMNGEVCGLLGNPIHIGALRYVSDTAFPPSECTIARATNDELNRGRTQMIRQRDRSMPQNMVDLGRIGGESGMEKLRQNQTQAHIPVTGLSVSDPPIVPISKAQYGRENFTFNEIIDNDLGQIWAMGRNQRGQESENSLTATEISKIDEWANTRLDKERRQILSYFVRGVRKLASLIQQFATDPQYIEVVGPDKQPVLTQWDRRHIQGKFAFKANPDSSIRIDQTQAQQRILKLYELLGKDPNVRRTEILEEVCRQWNLDPRKVVIEQVPEKGPDPASMSVKIDPEMLSLQNPNFPIYLALLKEAGYKSLDQPDPATGLTPIQAAFALAQHQQSIMAMAGGGQAPQGDPSSMIYGKPQQPPLPPNGNGAQAPHPGAMPHMDHISKHHADLTGQLPGPGPQVQ